MGDLHALSARFTGEQVLDLGTKEYMSHLDIGDNPDLICR